MNGDQSIKPRRQLGRPRKRPMPTTAVVDLPPGPLTLTRDGFVAQNGRSSPRRTLLVLGDDEPRTEEVE